MILGYPTLTNNPFEITLSFLAPRYCRRLRLPKAFIDDAKQVQRYLGWYEDRSQFVEFVANQYGK
jgi:hypothetical protein